MGRQKVDLIESSAIEVLRSFLHDPDVLDTQERRGSCEELERSYRRHDCSRSWEDPAASSVENKLKHLSNIDLGHLSREVVFQTTPGLAYLAVDALLRLVLRLLSRETPVVYGANGDEALEENGATPARRLVDLALLSLANFLEDLSWRHLFFRALHQIQVEYQRDKVAARVRCQRLPRTCSPTLALQGGLWRRLVTSAPSLTDGSTEAATGEQGGDGPRRRGARSETPPGGASKLQVSPLNHTVVRLTSHLVRQHPAFLPASSYASLAPHLTDYLLDTSFALAGDSGDVSVADLVAVLELFAACARGSLHFRQYVKGSHRKRELFKRLLGFLGLGPRGGNHAVVVRALCALTRVVAGDALEGKIFERSNALETGSLVMDKLLDMSLGFDRRNLGNMGDERESAIVVQRLYAEIAADIARSSVFMSTLLETGRLASFLREAVSFIRREGRRVLAGVSGTEGMEDFRDDERQALRREPGANDLESTRGSRRRALGEGDCPPEALLRALCSFCLEHSPGRSLFVQALVDPVDDGSDRRRDRDGTAGEVDPCMALYLLCVHPHHPTSAVASALLQCLLVGGGALGAMCGPSPGAVAGVGVIPMISPSCVGEMATSGIGIGGEDPLQAKLLERMGEIALHGMFRSRSGAGHLRAAEDRGGYVGQSAPGSDSTEEGVALSGSESEDDYADEDEERGGDGCGDGDISKGWYLGSDLHHAAGDRGYPGPASSGASIAEKREVSAAPGPLALLLRRLQTIGTHLASTQPRERFGLEVAGKETDRRAPGSSESGRRRGGDDVEQKSGTRGPLSRDCAVEAEEEITSLLCILSALARASPLVARTLARSIQLETSLAPVLNAQRDMLSGSSPVDYPRAPVEIVLVVLTLLAQLALSLSDPYCLDGASAMLETKGRAGRLEEARSRGGHSRWRRNSPTGDKRGCRQKRAKTERRRRRDAARITRLRAFIAQQTASGPVKLCLGQAACRAESKDMARRAASLISLLQAGGGADALLVADALYTYAQSAEAREIDLCNRAEVAEDCAAKERAAGEMRATALAEAEGLVGQIEARNAEEVSRLKREERGLRGRLEETHASALARAERTTRRAKESAQDVERVLRGKEEALVATGREIRAKDLEVAALRGDVAAERRLRIAAESRLKEACSERDEVARSKVEMGGLLETLKADLCISREENAALSRDLKEERVKASRGWDALREAEDVLEHANARAEDAYGKLILLAKGYKSLEDEARTKVAQADEELSGTMARLKLSEEKACEEARLLQQARTELRDTEASLQRAEGRVTKFSAEAAEFRTAAAAARAAGKDAAEAAKTAKRETSVAREEAASLSADLEQSRAACASKDLELSKKTTELGQQAGIIEYINRLSSSNTALAAVQASAEPPGDQSSRIPGDLGHEQPDPRGPRHVVEDDVAGSEA